MAFRGPPLRGGSALATLPLRGKLHTTLNELKRGLPFTTPTRLELINTRQRFTVPINNGGVLGTTVKPPAILFHPCRSIASLLVLNTSTTHDFSVLQRSGETNNTFLWDWNGSEATDGTNTLSITDSQFVVAEAIGVPSTLVSPLTRVTGGVLTMRITCGPGTTGYLAFSSPALSELTYTNTGVRDLYNAHSTNPRIRRYELVQGTQTHHFIAPITNAPALETFDEANDRFQWGTSDPYGATLITFHDVHYNVNLGVAPVVELYATVGLQCRLEIADRHLATNHGTGSKESKVKQSNGDGSAHIGTSRDGHSEHVKSTLKADSHGFPGSY